jgi:hypothetical protein
MFNQTVMDQVQFEINRTIKSSDLFWAASRKAKVGRVKRFFSRKSGKLESLEDLLKHNRVVGGYHAGLKSVPVDKIQGSEGRSKDFDAWFRPLGSHNRYRWQRVAEAREKGIALPPVELIQVGEVYYVRDGHHRISVARMLDEAYVEAVVQVLEVARV